MPTSLKQSDSGIKESTRRKLSRKLKKYWAKVHRIADRADISASEARRRYSASVVELLVRTPERDVYRKRFIEVTPTGTIEKDRRFAPLTPGKPRRIAHAGKKRFTKKYVDRIIKTQRYVAGVRTVQDLTGMTYRESQTFLKKTKLWKQKITSPEIQALIKIVGKKKRSVKRSRKRKD
jgi:hypothetical protein